MHKQSRLIGSLYLGVLSALCVIGCERSQNPVGLAMDTGVNGSSSLAAVTSSATVALVAVVNNKYVTVENNNTLVARAAVINTWEKFTKVDMGSGTIALKSLKNGMYVCADQNLANTQLICNRTAAKGWETFTLMTNSDGTVSLRASNGRYVCAESSGSAPLVANRSAAGGWEKFKIVAADGPVDVPIEVPTEWRKANLTHYTSYPDPNSDECLYYNGCTWAGYFAFISGKQPESWVRANNIIAVHSRDATKYKLKTLRIRQGTRQIDAKVYDMCSDSDCGGCCTQNADRNGIGFLIDIEKYTMERFGSGDGIVEWQCLDCN